MAPVIGRNSEVPTMGQFPLSNPWPLPSLRPTSRSKVIGALPFVGGKVTGETWSFRAKVDSPKVVSPALKSIHPMTKNTPQDIKKNKNLYR